MERWGLARRAAEEILALRGWALVDDLVWVSEEEHEAILREEEEAEAAYFASLGLPLHPRGPVEP